MDQNNSQGGNGDSGTYNSSTAYKPFGNANNQQPGQARQEDFSAQNTTTQVAQPQASQPVQQNQQTQVPTQQLVPVQNAPQVAQQPQEQQKTAATPPQPQVQAPQTPTVSQQKADEKPKRKLPIRKALVVVVLLVIIAGGALLASQFIGRDPGDVTPGAEEHTFEEFPDFSGIPINENTVSFAKVDNKFCLRYKGHIYLEQNSGEYEVREVESEDPDQYPWYGLVDAPEDLVVSDGEGDRLFSFKATPSNKSFVFIMQWENQNGEQYHMFRFNNNEFSNLRVFNQSADGLFYAPKLNEFSLGGNFVNIHMFPCAICTSQVPETLLYYIPTGETKDIGQVSYFSWGEDDNTYEYKDYEQGISPDELPLRRNEFFEESVDLLLP